MANLNNTKNFDTSIKFDMTIKPKKQPIHLKLLAWILSYSAFITQKQTLEKIEMDGVKPPYLLLCNHNAFIDFKVTTKAIFPHSANYVVAIDGFIKREKLLRDVGCICKRKFTNDIVLIKHLIYVIKKLKQICIVYPEARYSLVGTASKLPESLGKLTKLLDVPVVILTMHGHHISSPVYNLHIRKNPLYARMKQVLTVKDVQTKSVDEINAILEQEFAYDDYKYQLDNHIRITDPNRAKGLEKVLYQCPSCKTEFQMRSHEHVLTCDACQKTYEMDEFGAMKARDGITEFTHIPDWYNWERNFVRTEILQGNYHIEDDCIVDSLPNADGFIALGEGHFVHTKDGFVLTYQENGETKVLHKPVVSMESVHIEFDYNNRGDGVDLTTLTDNFYVYFKNLKNVVTKIHFATEELYLIKQQELKNKKQ